MAPDPNVVVTHEAPHQATPAGIGAAIRDRLPDVDLTVSDSVADTRRLAADADVVVSKRFPATLVEGSDRLAWIQSMTAGLDGYDAESIADANVALTAAEGVNARPVAEQALAYVLAFERRLIQGVRRDGRGEWQRYTAGEVGDRTMAIVGLGAIGSTLAEFASGLGMTVVGSKRDASESVPNVDRVYPATDLHDLVADADYVVIACPLTPETRGLIDGDVFSSMPDDAVIINVARGGIVDEDALLRAIRKNYLRGAALDVQSTEPLPSDHELWSSDRVLVTPHTAGSTPNYEARLADVFAEHYAVFLEEPSGFRNRHAPPVE